MIRKIIAIVICLLVIVGTVSCAADKKEPTAQEPEEEEEELPPSEESLPFDLRYAEDFDQMADCFVQALFLPNMSLLLGSFHPDLLAYMARVDGLSEEALDAAAEKANKSITGAWADVESGAEYSDLTYEYTAHQATSAQWEQLSEIYDQVSLTPEEAAILEMTILCKGSPIGTVSFGLVLIGGTWWADPVLSH